MVNKINSYIGFAIKSRKILYGADNILFSKTCKLVIASEQLSAGTISKIKNKNLKIIILPTQEYISLNLKGLVVGITDSSLAQAINNQFSVQ